MLSQAFKSASASVPSPLLSYNSLRSPVPVPVAHHQANSVGSLQEDDLFEFESPRSRSAMVAIPSPQGLQRAQVDVASSYESQESLDMVFGNFEAEADVSTSLGSHGSGHAQFSIADSSAPPSGNSSQTHAGILQTVPSHEFTIGRAALHTAGSSSLLDLDSDFLGSRPSSSSRLSRPIVIPRASGVASTYAHPAGQHMAGFVPPHEITAASYADTTQVVHSSRHKSTADRLKSAMFEQTGFLSHSTAQNFLHSAAR